MTMFQEFYTINDGPLTTRIDDYRVTFTLAELGDGGITPLHQLWLVKSLLEMADAHEDKEFVFDGWDTDAERHPILHPAIEAKL